MVQPLLIACCNKEQPRRAQQYPAQRVFRRISRTEYTFRFQLRDARSSDLIAAGDSGLRIS
jgi:hypothetical protein